MAKNLQARLAKLEEATVSGEIPNGEILLAVLREGEAVEEAVGRAMAQPEIVCLSKTQQGRLALAVISEADAKY